MKKVTFNDKDQILIDSYTVNVEKWYNIGLRLDNINSALLWYETAHSICKRIADYYDLTLQQVCGIMAVLSPQNKWSQNVLDCEALIIDDIAKVSTFNRNKQKALQIKYCYELEKEVSDIVSGNKVTSFYNNLLSPHNQDYVTVDRHAVRCALDDISSRFDEIKNYGRNKHFHRIAQAYKNVAKKHNISVLKVQSVCWVAIRIELGLK
jgi:plasmid replication initiation protein